MADRLFVTAWWSVAIALFVVPLAAYGVASAIVVDPPPCPTAQPTADTTATFAAAVETRAVQFRMDAIETTQARWFAHETAVWGDE